MKIKTGDKVEIIIGKDRGRSGEVLRVFPKKNSLIVKGLNIFKRHQKGTSGQAGKIIEKEFPLASSKVMLLCPQCKKRTRVAFQIDKSGEKSRICRKCKAVIASAKK